MIFRATIFFLALAASVTSPARADDSKPAMNPGFVTRVMNAFHPSRSENDKTGVVRTKNLLLTMDLSPLPLSLSDTRMLKVVLALTNKSEKMVQLEFPTTQRFDILLRDKAGKQLMQWSEDQLFDSEQTVVTINPGEHIEYETSIATRDLTAGREFVVEGYFLNYKELKIKRTIIPKN